MKICFSPADLFFVSVICKSPNTAPNRVVFLPIVNKVMFLYREIFQQKNKEVALAGMAQ